MQEKAAGGRRGRHKTALAVLFAVVVGLILALHPAVAPASTASVSGSGLTYVASPGERNVVTFSVASPSGITITDTGTTISAGPGCTSVSPHEVTCASGFLSVDVADQDDIVTLVDVAATVDGGSGSDTLNGGPSDDRLSGGPGDDILNGHEGDDTLVGGSGSDAFNGGGNTVTGTGVGLKDTVDYSDRSSPVTVDIDGVPDDGGTAEGDNVATDIESVIGGSSDDSLIGSASPNFLIGGSGNDVVDGGGEGDFLIGGEGDDILNGGAGADSVDANPFFDAPGDDTLNGGDGNDHLAGRTGADTLNGDGGADALAGGEGDDDLRGGSGDDHLVPDFGSDTVSGDSGDDWIEAGFCGDRFIVICGASEGSDALAGGDGTDSVSYARRQAGVLVTLDGVANDGEAGEGDGVSTIENIGGGDRDDTLSGDDRSNLLDGGQGNDTLNGGAGNDSLIGGLDGADVLNGGAGEDALDGGSGPQGDVFNGGDGIDTADYSSRNDPVTVDLDGKADDGATGEHDNVGPLGDVENIVGGSEFDVLRGNAAVNVLSGGDGDDLLGGGPATDVLIGGPGRDSADYSDHMNAVAVDLDGVADDGELGENENVGIDIEGIRGGAGNDTLIGNEGANTLEGGPGDDLLEAGFGADELIGGTGDDGADYSGRASPVIVDLDGSAGDDGETGEGDTVGADVEDIFGGSGSDTLIGNASGNSLEGGSGDDVLDGGLGDDLLAGGGGDDLADYSTRTGSVAVDLDGAVGDDGELGEGDTVGGDVEDVLGGSGDDVLGGNQSDNLVDGGAGDDLLDGRLGADKLVGGGDLDIVDYSERTSSLTVDLDGALGDDGETGEGDTVGADVEGILGGSGADTLTGNAGDNLLDGGLGADVLVGGGGLDLADYSSRTTSVTVTLDGSAGDGEAGEGDLVGGDVEDVAGGAANDVLVGNAGVNLLLGGPGADALDGGPSFDIFDGGDDDDRIQSRDGAVDLVLCGGGGGDSVVADGPDLVVDCEQVDKPPPIVVTGDATEIGETSATLNGTVNPNGQTTTVYAELGTTSAYGVRSPEVNVGAGTGDLAGTAKTTGLLPGTTYHYRFVATNAAGTSVGTDRTFTTAGTQLSPPPPTRPRVRVTQCRVPNVKGKTLAAARKALNRSHCTTGKVSRVNSKKVRKGRVIAQSPRPGTRLRNRGKVSLVVSRGRKP